MENPLGFAHFLAHSDGIARFTTIYPGAYDGRWPHIDFEVYR